MTLVTSICRTLAVAVSLHFAATALAVVNVDAPDVNDHRWDAVCAIVNLGAPSPPVTGECPAGPPDSGDASSGSGVLIMPNKVITASHVVVQGVCGTPNMCAWFKFRRLPNGNIGDFYAEVASWEIADCAPCPGPGDFNGGVCDIAIATLKTPITHIKPIRVDLDPDLSDAERGTCDPIPAIEVYGAVAGWGKGGEWLAGPPATCSLETSYILRASAITSVKLTYTIGDQMTFDVLPCTQVQTACPLTGFVPSHAKPAQYDSGGAILVEDPETCELRLIAVITEGNGNPILKYHDSLDEGLSIPVYAGCPADLNYDGVVNGSDLPILIAAWGACPAACPCPADLDHSGSVNGTDLGILNASYGSCP